MSFATDGALMIARGGGGSGRRGVRQRRTSLLVGVVLAVIVAMLMVSSSARADACPAPNPSLTGPCGPTFTVPSWGDAAGWRSRDQFSTIQIGDVLGNGRDQLIARSAAGIEIYQFDTTLGQWRPEVDGNDRPVILSAFSDPPPLTTAQPTNTGTDWTEPQYYSTIQLGDVLGIGRDQILARSQSGMIIFSYTPGPDGKAGSWAQVTSSGPFSDSDGFTQPSAYSTIHTGDLLGDGRAELMGISSTQGAEFWRWNGSGWNETTSLPDLAGQQPPTALATAQFANVDGSRAAQFWDLSTLGLDGIRYVNGHWQTLQNLDPLALGPFPDAYYDRGEKTPWQQSPSYWQTMQFGNITGGAGDEVLARGVDGLEAYHWTGSAWKQLATLTALSDANGFNQDKYWRTIQLADIDGSGRQEVLARGSQGLSAYKYDPASNSWSQLPGTIGLTDDPWGSDQSYYSTIRTGDIAGDGRDAVIARGPYGIRTWFYDRPGVTGWSSYLPSGYPAFATNDEQAAFAVLNAQAHAQGLLTRNETTVRDLWAQENEPSDSDLMNLKTGLQTIGNCSKPLNLAPIQYQACSPPSGSGVQGPAWTSVINEMLAERFDAQQVVDFYGELNRIRQDVFISENAILPALKDQLNLDAAKDTPADFNLTGLFSGITSIASTAAGFFNPGLSAALAITSTLFSMIPSASPDLTDTVREKYAALQGTFATAVTQADATLASQSQTVRTNLGLLRLVGDLRQAGTWQLDGTGMKSAAREGFTLWVTKTLVPLIYARYLITGCTHVVGSLNSCTPPPTGPWLLPEPNNGFDSIGPPPSSGFPCDREPIGRGNWKYTCNFAGPDPTIGNIVWGLVSPSCAYQPGNANVSWTYGCSLGVDPLASVNPLAKINSDKEYWNFNTYNGAPCLTQFCYSGASLAGTAQNVGRSSGAVQLKGDVALPRSINLRTATIVLSRLLYDTGGRAALVRTKAAPGRFGATGEGSTTQPLGPVVLHPAGKGSFHSALVAARGQSAPSLALHLTQPTTSSMSFDLKVANVALPAPPAACGLISPRLSLNPPPVPLNLQLRILEPPMAPASISLNPSFACRRDRSGAVRTLTIVQPHRRVKLGRGLSLTTHVSRSAARFATLSITVRNRTRTTADDVLVAALVPFGLRVVSHPPGARTASNHVQWRLPRIGVKRSRTFRLTVAGQSGVSGRRCTRIIVQGALRRITRGIACTAVSAPHRQSAGLG